MSILKPRSIMPAVAGLRPVRCAGGLACAARQSWGFAFLASLTAMRRRHGCATLLLDRNPVFWIADLPWPLAIALRRAVLVFLTAASAGKPTARVNQPWLDALGPCPSRVAAAGVARGQRRWPGACRSPDSWGRHGLFRGALARHRRTTRCRSESATGQALCHRGLAGAAAYLCRGHALAVGPAVPSRPDTLVCFALRAGSLLFGWQMPVYKAAPAAQLEAAGFLDLAAGLETQDAATHIANKEAGGSWRHRPRRNGIWGNGEDGGLTRC